MTTFRGRKPALRVAAFVALLFAGALPLCAASFTASTTGNWSSSATWGGAGVPGSGDSATIGSGITVTLDVPVTVDSLTLSNGTVTGSNSIAINTTFNWSAGTLSGSGSTTFPASCTATVNSTAFLDTRPLSNSGTIVIAGGNTFFLQNNAVLTNSGTIDFQSDGSLVVNGAPGTTALVNSGTIKKSAGTGTSQIAVSLTAQSGSQQLAQSGTLDVAAVSSTGATFDVSSGASIDFNTNDTRTFDAASSFTGSGTVAWVSGTNTVNAVYNLTGVTLSSGGTTTINSPASAGSITVSSGTLTLNGASTLNVPILTMSGGTLAGSAPISVTNSSMTWTGGTIGGTGPFTVPSGTTITLNGYVYFDTRAITNGGAFVYSSNYYSYLYNGATLTNNGSVDFQGDGGFYIGSGSDSIINNGTITKSAGTGQGGIQVPLTANSGSQLQVQSGTLLLGDVTSTGSTLSVSSGATAEFYYTTAANFDAASTISGAGTVIFVAGTNSINASYNITGATTASGGTSTIGANITSLGALTANGGALTINNGSVPTITTITAAGGTLTLNIPSTITVPTVTMSGGTLNGTAAITVTAATLTWTGGTLGGTGTFTVQPGTTITLNGYLYFDTRAIVNSGAFVYTNNYYSYFYNGATFTNNGSVNFQGDGGFYIGSGTDAVINNGTITKSAGTGQGGIQVPLTASSGSQLLVQSGSLLLGNVTSTGSTLNVSSGATVQFYYTTTASFDAASTINGAGTVIFSAGTNTISASYNITGATTANGGTTTIGTSITSLGALTVNGGTLTINNGSVPTITNIAVGGGTLTLNIPSTITVPSLTMSGGILNGTASIAVTNSALTWTGGTIGGSGTLTIPPGTTVTVNGYLYFDTAAIVNGGAFVYTSNYYSYFYNGATFTNNGSVNFQGDGGFYIGSGSDAVINNGTITKSGGTGQGSIQVPLTANSGSQLLVQSGTLVLGNVTSSGSTLSVSSGATVQFYYTTTSSFDAASTISGAGSVIFGAGTNTINAAYNITGATSVTGGTTTIGTNIVSVSGLTMSGGTLTLNSASAITVPTLTMQGGTLNGTAAINITGPSMTWSAGTIGGSATLSIPVSTTVTIAGGVSFDGRQVTNAGSINFTGTNYIYMLNNAVLTNSGTIDMQGDNAIYINGVAGTTAIINSGVIKKSGGSGIGTIGVALTAQSGSQVLAQSGTLMLGAVTSSGATFAVSNAATLSFSTSDTRAFDAASSITATGTGTVQWAGGTNTVNGAYNVASTGTTSVNGGTTTLNSITSAGSIVSTAGTLTLNGGALTVPTLTMQGGTVNGTAPINLTGSAMTWSGGTIGGNATLSIPSTATITISGVLFFDGRTINNPGTINITSTNYFYMQNNAVVNNSGTIDLQGDGGMYLNSAVGSIALNNSGTIKKSTGSGQATIQPPLIENAGQVLIQSGVMNLGAVTSTGGTFSLSAGNLTFNTADVRTFDAASTISGTGVLQVSSGTNTVSGTMSTEVLMVGGTLTVNTASTQTIPKLTMQGGTLNGTAAITVTGLSMNWTGGTIGGTGALNLQAAATVTISGVVFFDQRPISNPGTIAITGSNYFYMQNNAVLTNSGTIDLQGDGGMYLNSAVGTTAVNSTGTIKKSQGTGVSGATITVPVTQSGGQFQLQSGTLNMGAVTATSAPFTLNAGTTLTFNTGDVRTFDSASSIGGTGTVMSQGGTTTVSGTITVPVVMNAGTLNVNSASAQSIPTLTLQGGTFGGTAAVNLTGSAMTWSGGMITGSGTLSLASSTAVTDSGAFIIDARPVSLAGRINVIASDYFYLQNSASLTNNGTIDLQGDGGIYLNTGSATLTNNGVLTKSAGIVTSQVTVPFTNAAAGTIRPVSGTLQFTNLTSSGTLQFPIASATAGTGFGTIAVSSGSPFILGGTLSATTTGGYTPPNGTTFQIITATPSLTGAFAAKSLSYPAGAFTDSASSSAVTLTAGPSTCVTAPSGIVSWYKAEGNANDSIGPNNGSLLGGASFASAKVGQGFVFGSDTDGVTVPSNNNLNMNATGFTVEFWMRGVHNQPQSLYCVAEKSHGEIDFTGWAFQGDSTTGLLSFVTGDGTAFPALGSINDLLDGTFHHVAGVWDGSVVYLYVDGALQASAPLTSPANNTRPVNFGYHWGNGTPNRFFRGALDELTVYSRALSAAEVQGIFNADSSGKCFVPPGAPTIGGISPAAGPTAGGTTITITGTNLGNVTSVTFGTLPATITAQTATTLTVIAPSHVAQVVDVAVTNLAGTATATAAYTYTSAPLISGFTPASGPSGTLITINGSGFSTATTVQFNGISATFTIVSDAQINATVPAGATTGPITITNAIGNGTSSTSFIVGTCVAPVISASGPTTFCTGGSVTLTASAGVSYLWSTGATSQSITVNSSGNFTVQVTDANGCNGTSAPATVTVNPPPSATITPSGPTTFCTGGSVTLTAPAGMASYAWSNGAITQAITVNSSGTFTVQVVDTLGCSATSTPTTVTANAAPSATVTASGPTTFCAGGSVTLTAPAGMSSYLWSTGATAQSITVTTSGSYTVRVFVSTGCSTLSTPTAVTVNPSPSATITASGPTTFCTGGNVTLTAPAGMSSYAWSNGATTQAITVSASGTFNVTVTNAAGCSVSSAAVNVNVTSPPTVTITGPTTSCGSSSVTLDAGPGFATYNWSTGDTTQTIAVPVAATTTFTVTVTDAAGCSASATHTVTASPSAVSTITAPASMCPTTTATASVAATAGATYLWSITGGTIASGAGTSSITFTPSGTTPVTLGVTVTSGGCSSTSSAIVSVTSSAGTAISGPGSICQGGRATLDAGVHATYAWSTGDTTRTISVSPTSTTSYTVTVTDAGGCTATASRTLVVEPPPAATLTAPSSVDANSTGNSASVDAPSATSFVWTIAGGAITSGQGSSSIGFTAGTGGTISLTVTVSSGACFTTRSATITVNPLTCSTNPPTLLAPADGATGVISPAAFSWTAVPGAISYDLVITAGSSTNIQSTTATSLTVAVPSGGISWNVIAHLSQSCTPTTLTSATRGFTATESNACSRNLPPVPLSPANVTTFSPITFEWQPAQGAIGYRVQWQINGNAPQEIDTTDTSVTVISGESGPGTWSVSALYSGCSPVPSQPLGFTLEKEDCSKHSATTLSQPGDGATASSSSIDFAWTKVEGADGYRVWVRIDGGDPQALGDTVDTALHHDLPAGSMQWYVETLFDGCPSTFSTTRTFTVPAAQTCGSQTPTLNAPVDITVDKAQVTFTWSSVSDAISYELYLAAANGAPALLGTTTSTSLTREVPPNLDLEWFVRVNVNGCPSRTSSSAKFRFEPPATCPQGRPVLTAPADDGSGVTSPVTFAWTQVAGAKSYNVYIVKGNAGHGTAATPELIGSPAGATLENVTVGNGAWQWYVEPVFDSDCASTQSTESRFLVVAAPAACTPLPPPKIAAPSQISSGGSFTIRWNALPGASSYVLQEATDGGFITATSTTTPAASARFTHANDGTSPQTFFYRVRAIDSRCSPAEESAFSEVAQVTVLPAVSADGSTLVGESQTVNFTIPIGPEHAGQSFSATPTRPWLSVTPASGTVGAGGTTLNVVANINGLSLGTSLGGVTLTFGSSGVSGRIAPNDGGGSTVPVSVTIVAPAVSNPKSTPPPDALIIPAVANAFGVNSKFQSDVRVTNTSPQVMKYQVTFTPSGDQGIAQGKQTTIDIDPGRTIALDDVLRTWFGEGNGNATGTLEIRPLTQAASSTSSNAVRGLANFVTFASSRTFAVTDNGTFGQFIGAVPFANFVGGGSANTKAAVLSLQQIAQSPAFRTNLGLVEGSGQPVSVLVNVFGSHGEQLTSFPVNLNGGQHLQLNSFLAQQNVQVDDARVEVSVTGGSGKITAYASVLDNRTNDPLLVSPVTVSNTTSSKYVLPGVARIAGGANWQTDARLFNASDTAVKATMTFQSIFGNPVKTAAVDIGPHEVVQLDNALETLFGLTNDGGALDISTDKDVNLVATARTYRPDPSSGGTFGQFIEAVTPDQAVKLGTRPLQLLQVEESDRYRSNIGVAEVQGKPATVEITVIPPDSKLSASVRVDLAPNQARQFNSMLASMGFSDTSNARVTVRVVGGSGSVTAYASVIDQKTQDATAIPAQ